MFQTESAPKKTRKEKCGAYMGPVECRTEGPHTNEFEKAFVKKLRRSGAPQVAGLTKRVATNRGRGAWEERAIIWIRRRPVSGSTPKGHRSPLQ
uniref:Uncharacterized protein n=1 Tax=Steinernema glaseri TaxID=37863 RepID=A0A1I8AB55_9BILA